MDSPIPGKDRAAYLRTLGVAGSHWDLLVIGGGASGLGIALDAVSRGLKVLLVEQSDFAKGTSSRSTKLVHGGVRYLAQGDIRLVREASVERGILHRNAAHLVKDQAFLVPVYSYFARLKYYIGLKLYDWISGSLSLGSSIGLSRELTMKRMPGLRKEGLRGSILYHDGQFDDARLAVNLAQTIVEQGGEIISYMAVNGLVKDENGMVKGVRATDAETGAQFLFNASVVVNATGVFADEILRMDNPGSKSTIRPSQGVHLVLDRSFFPSEDALMIPETTDGRVLFALPWHDKLVIGTTDTPVDKASMEPAALESEIGFILANAGDYLVSKPTRSDVLSVFAGLRPLAAPAGDGSETKEISRSHKIIRTASGMYNIIGGKWTTYRRMGEDLVDQVVSDAGFGCGVSRTRDLSIHGNMQGTDFNDPYYYYGSDREIIMQQIETDPDGWLSKPLFLHEAQIRWSIDHEMARTVEDLLARRTRLLFLDAREAMRLAPRVAELMASALGYGDEWIAGQLHQFGKVAANYIPD